MASAPYSSSFDSRSTSASSSAPYSSSFDSRSTSASSSAPYSSSFDSRSTSFEAKSTTDLRCAHCGKSASESQVGKLLACDSRQTLYCSNQCQIQDFPSHQPQCSFVLCAAFLVLIVFEFIGQLMAKQTVETKVRKTFLPGYGSSYAVLVHPHACSFGFVIRK